jgi:hypothetical protein
MYENQDIIFMIAPDFSDAGGNLLLEHKIHFYSNVTPEYMLCMQLYILFCYKYIKRIINAYEAR